MSGTVDAFVGDLIKSSDFLKSLSALKKNEGSSRLFDQNVRSLSRSEIRILEKQNNLADDWTNILVVKDFSPDHIFGNRFQGRCVLGNFSGATSAVDGLAMLKTGIYDSTVIDSEVGNDALIYQTGMISNYIIQEAAVVFRIGSLVANTPCSFGNGIEIKVGPETGGREILSYTEMNLAIAEAVVVRRDDHSFLDGYQQFIESYVSRITMPSGVIESGSVLKNTSNIASTFIGRNTIVDGAILVENSTILSSLDEKTEISHGVMLKDSCVQPGCQVTSMAIVEKSLLMEHSCVKRHGKVTHSIIGPNSVIAEGEVTSSLVGPFVGFHHQALLIAAIWPEGRGNIGYGANVGSNHTSKAPDQEIWCGEGTFFGLGINVKYPSNFSDAPYSIIATGVDTLPQKVTFPFSLINKPSKTFDHVPPDFNEIIPGWVLSGNIYAVFRNEKKFIQRNQARRNDLTNEVFRPVIIDKMITARNALQNINKKQTLYLEKDIHGLGKNYLLDGNRRRGMEAYQFYVGYYLLKGLMNYLTDKLDDKKKMFLQKIYSEKTGNAVWEHQRLLMIEEKLNQKSVIENLKTLLEMQERIAKSTQNCKERDDGRGNKIIRDYAVVHTPGSKDIFVMEMWEKTDKIRKQIDRIIKILE